MVECGVVKREVLFFELLVAKLGDFGFFVDKMDGELGDFDVELDFFEVGVGVLFGSGIFVEIDGGDSHHDAVGGSFLLVWRVVHVEFDDDVFYFDFDVEEYFFECFLEEVHGVVLAKLFSGEGVFDLKERVFLDFLHALFKVLVEVFVGLKLDEYLVGLDLYTFCDDFC